LSVIEHVAFAQRIESEGCARNAPSARLRPAITGIKFWLLRKRLRMGRKEGGEFGGGGTGADRRGGL